MGVTRRNFLNRLGAVGGTGAVFGAMQTMGLLATEAAARPLALPANCGAGSSVVILGAGMAGLVSAYELERAGFKVTLIEARERVGGRNWTIRGGARVQMNGETDQICTWGDGMYFNAGPARLPSHHQGVLDYAKALGVPLEVEINSSRSSYLLPSNGAPMRQRTAINDTRGHISELLAKAINKGALDQDMTVEEKQRLMPFLKAYGDLADDMTFKGTERSGYKVLPGANDQIGEHFAPAPLQTLLENERLPMSLFEENIEMQATMFQPVGGMDQIPMGFQRAIKSPILRQAEVTSIRQSPERVSVAIRDFKTGKTSTVKADFAIVTIPLTVLAKIDNNFDKPVKQAIAGVEYEHANKIGFESPRFWEREQIYGGISFVGGETNLVWYPSWGLHTDKAVLVACYGVGAIAKSFAKRPLAEQIAVSTAIVDRLHPGKASEMSKPIVVNWSKIPYNLGAWSNWNPEAAGREGGPPKPGYTLLNKPHGRVHFCGSHLSQMPGWQEGAVLSAHRTIKALVSQAGAKAAPAKG